MTTGRKPVSTAGPGGSVVRAIASTPSASSTSLFSFVVLGGRPRFARPVVAVAIFAAGRRVLDGPGVPGPPVHPARAFPRRPRLFRALPSQVLRSPALGAPQAALGRQPHQRHHQGHPALRGPMLALLASGLSVDTLSVVAGGAPARLRRRGMGPPFGALLPLSTTCTSATSNGTTCTITAPRAWDRLRAEQRLLGRRLRDADPPRDPTRAPRAQRLGARPHRRLPEPDAPAL